ncbi:hypothetical protein [Streptomyces sp. Y1]|uniref:Uncharacterized protein n=1 Tax=Streptomyces sp. Y1 TaxID=3238634 RepID=A0AB39TPW4_9ACTN
MRPNPWTRTPGSPQACGGRHQSPRSRSDFDAFVQLNEPYYLKYARTRLAAEELGAEAVAWTLGYLEAEWTAILGCSQPMATCWSVLRGAVSRRSAPGRLPGNWLHTVLPDDAADAVLLKHRLGVELPVAARLMGVGTGVVEVQLRAALRILARA